MKIKLLLLLILLSGVSVVAQTAGVKCGYIINITADTETFDAFPVNITFQQKKLGFDFGIMLCREMPGKAFKSSLGYNGRILYELFSIGKNKVYGSYSFEKYKQKVPYRESEKLYKNILQQSLGVASSRQLFLDKLSLFLHVDYAISHYYYKGPYSGNGNYFGLLVEMSFKYYLNKLK